MVTAVPCSTETFNQNRNIVVVAFAVVILVLMLVASIDVRSTVTKRHYEWIEMDLSQNIGLHRMLFDQINIDTTVMNKTMKSINVANI